MASKKQTIILIIGFIILIGIAYFAYTILKKDIKPITSIDLATESRAETASGIEENEIFYAPDFTVFDNDKNPVKLSDFAGKPVIINFWATWCPYCIDEMPYFEEQYLKNRDEVEFLMIDVVDGDRETVEKGKEFIEKNGFTFPVYYDTGEDKAAYIYEVSSMPTTVFIDAKGELIAYQPGMLSEDNLKKGIELIKK